MWTYIFVRPEKFLKGSFSNVDFRIQALDRKQPHMPIFKNYYTLKRFFRCIYTYTSGLKEHIATCMDFYTWGLLKP